MTKDFNHWRKMFIAYKFDMANREIERVEEECDSPIEKIVYLQLLKVLILYGMYHMCINPQKKFGIYTLDFEILYESQGVMKKIAIECDGHDFHEKTKDQASKDKKKDRELQKSGYSILRYSGSDIVNNPFQVTTDLAAILGQPEWVNKNG